ncbi:hypothetical protein [Kineococcus endophyticus]|uniref:hypothetical protein n=1 Tax=Kineococcus endophyticus TaxID=1181883 RepID=UPI0034645EE4
MVDLPAERSAAACEVQRWVDAVRAGTNVDGPDVRDGYAATAVCAAAIESLCTGERVVVDLEGGWGSGER